jgi:hypothetical protein
MQQADDKLGLHLDEFWIWIQCNDGKDQANKLIRLLCISIICVFRLLALPAIQQY